MSQPDLLSRLRGGLLVSCQAWEGDAFRDSGAMARFAKAAQDGGAVGIRANGPEDIAAIRQVVTLPIIGIQKATGPDGRLLITPNFESAAALHRAGAEIIALDCTSRGASYGALARIAEIKRQLGATVFADIATVEEGLAAAEAGADAILSTLRGYTDDTRHVVQFEPAFIHELVVRSPVPVIAEGRIHTPAEARAAMAAGAFATIVGTAITRPTDITRWFASAVSEGRQAAAQTRYFMGVDLGGTNTKFGIVSSGGELVWHSLLPTPAKEGREALLLTLSDAVASGLQHATEIGLPIASIGVATAGWVNHRTGEIAYATENLPGWTGTAVADHIANRFHMPVLVENDANALAVGEKHFGAARSLNHFAVVTLGTGVGGGVYSNGHLNRGAHFFANAFGHITLIPNGKLCSCGRRGCLEVYTNAAALRRYAHGTFATVRAVLDAASSGDRRAIKAIDRLARFLAQGCATLVNLLDPQAIILAGGLATNNPVLIQSLIKEIEALVPAWERRQIQIAESKLGYYGGVFGAAALALEPTGH